MTRFFRLKMFKSILLFELNIIPLPSLFMIIPLTLPHLTHRRNVRLLDHRYLGFFKLQPRFKLVFMNLKRLNKLVDDHFDRFQLPPSVWHGSIGALATAVVVSMLPA